MSIYTELKEVGVPTDNHSSDLYAKKCPISDAILAEHGKANVRSFISALDGEEWYEIPFQFDPFWEKRVGA
jgi:hypothetical protein